MDITGMAQKGGSVVTHLRFGEKKGDLYAGITYINAPTIGAEVHLPFGGVKATGNGHREGGIGAIDFYTEWKSVYVDYSDKLQKAQIDRVD